MTHGKTDVRSVLLTVIPMTTATISLVSSAAIVAMIYRSSKKLKDSYRRIIFGMSMFDICSSLAVTFKIFKSTPESSNANMWLPLGNQASCSVLTFLHVVGTVGVTMYSLNINIYYFYLVKRNMKEKDFRKKIEPFLHAVPVLWTIAGAIYIWAAKLMNPTTVMGACFIAATPLGCNRDDEVGCEGAGDKVFLITMIYMGCPLVFCFALSIGLLVAIWYKVRSQEKRMDKYRFKRVSLKMSVSLKDQESLEVPDVMKEADGDGSNAIVKALKERINHRRQMKRTPSKSREFLSSAFWYAAAFMITFTFPYIVTIAGLMGTAESPFALKIFSRLLQPLQGLFNMLVYTRPHVRNYRSRYPESNWLKALLYVVSKGGDDDRTATQRSRRSSMSQNRRSSMSNNLQNSTNYPTRRNSMFGPVRRDSLSNHLQRTTSPSSPLAPQDVGVFLATRPIVPSPSVMVPIGRRRSTLTLGESFGSHTEFPLSEETQESKNDFESDDTISGETSQKLLVSHENDNDQAGCEFSTSQSSDVRFESEEIASSEMNEKIISTTSESINLIYDQKTLLQKNLVSTDGEPNSALGDESFAAHSLDANIADAKTTTESNDMIKDKPLGLGTDGPIENENVHPCNDNDENMELK